jgi:hypothetical protein
MSRQVDQPKSKPDVTLKLEGSNIRLALANPGALFSKDPIRYMPWYLWDGTKSYNFGFNRIRSAPAADILGWRVHTQIENHVFHRCSVAGGVLEWFGPNDLPTVTIKWKAKRGCLTQAEKIEGWLQHWSFKTWVTKIDDADRVSHAQEIGRWYWEVRKTPELIRQLVEKARKVVDKPQQTVEEVMSRYDDRFYQAHKWDWFYQGCPSDEVSGVFSDVQAFCDAPVDDVLEVPGLEPVKLKPHGWVSVPPFRNIGTSPRPINDEGDDEATNELLRIPTTRPPKKGKA